jgi:hypothetical protein
MKQKSLCLFILAALLSTSIQAQVLPVKKLETLLLGGAEQAKDHAPEGFTYLGGDPGFYVFGSFTKPADFIYFYYSRRVSIKYRIPSKSGYANFRNQLKTAGYTERKDMAMEDNGTSYITYASAKFYIMMNAKDEPDESTDKYYQITITERAKQ